MLEVHISKHSLFRLKITVGCLTSRYPSIHLSPDEDILKFTVGCRLCTCPSTHFFVSRSRSVVRVVLVLASGGGVVCCVGVVWWCGVVWSGVGCMFVFFCVVFLFFLSILFFLLLTLSLSFSLLSFISLLSSLLFSLPRFLFSSLHVTKHCGKNRSHNTAANFEACECDLAHGRCTAVGSLSSSYPLPPSSSKKSRELFIIGIFPATNLFFITVLN